MADIYSLQQAAGTLHRELSFDVDGRFATYEGVRAEERDGVLHLVVVLSTKSDGDPAGPGNDDQPGEVVPDAEPSPVPDIAGGDL